MSFAGVDIGPVSAALTLGGIPSGMDHQMPTSLEALVRYRAVHADCHESRRVWLFHSHTYFDHAAPDCVAEARAFMDLIQRTGINEDTSTWTVAANVRWMKSMNAHASATQSGAAWSKWVCE